MRAATRQGQGQGAGCARLLRPVVYSAVLIPQTDKLLIPNVWSVDDPAASGAKGSVNSNVMVRAQFIPLFNAFYCPHRRGWVSTTVISGTCPGVMNNIIYYIMHTARLVVNSTVWVRGRLKPPSMAFIAIAVVAGWAQRSISGTCPGVINNIIYYIMHTASDRQ